jgi:hypothetical protein
MASAAFSEDLTQVRADSLTTLLTTLAEMVKDKEMDTKDRLKSAAVLAATIEDMYKFDVISGGLDEVSKSSKRALDKLDKLDQLED